MLNRSTKSERIIEMNEKLQEQLQNEIDHLQEKLNQLNQHFQTKKNHFSLVKFYLKRLFFSVYSKNRIGC